MSEKILRNRGVIARHTLLELMEHWAIALSGLVLLVTGMFQLPMANRYYITSVPGLAWSGNFIISLNIHYIASVIFVAASLFHLFYHGLQNENGLLPRRGDLKASISVIKSFFGKGEEPPFHKYLPEQRLAYIGMAFVIALLIISGLVKVYKNVYAPDMNYTVVLWATWIHNIGFILFILAFIGHIGALILKPNRPMVRGIFTGKVRLDYAGHRHPLWMADMEKAPTMEETPAILLPKGPVITETMPVMAKDDSDNIADTAAAESKPAVNTDVTAVEATVTLPADKNGNIDSTG